jgi:hypothetical protein
MKIRWPLGKPRMADMQCILERYRAVLHLMLTVLQIAESRQMKYVTTSVS